MRRSYTVVIVHLEVNKQLPISIGRSVCLERILAVSIVIKEFVELRALVVLRAHFKIRLGVFLAALCEIPILVGHIIGCLVFDHSAAIFVIGRLDQLLVLHVGIILRALR